MCDNEVRNILVLRDPKHLRKLGQTLREFSIVFASSLSLRRKGGDHLSRSPPSYRSCHVPPIAGAVGGKGAWSSVLAY
jgi:hypothetical protein